MTKLDNGIEYKISRMAGDGRFTRWHVSWAFGDSTWRPDETPRGSAYMLEVHRGRAGMVSVQGMVRRVKLETDLERLPPFGYTYSGELHRDGELSAQDRMELDSLLAHSPVPF
jgi:hypothetical protein